MSTWAALLLGVAGAPAAWGQTWDTSGNALLQKNATYYFREVAWLVGDQSGSVSEARAIYGNMTFDGNGNYSLSNAQICDSDGCGNAATVQPYTTTTGAPSNGTYSIAANGYGFITNLVLQGHYIYGAVSPQGVFIGSSTDNGTGYNDLFIAAPLASPQPTNAFFNGTYAMASVDFPGSGDQTNGVYATRASSFSLRAGGGGSFDNFIARGFIAANGATPTSQTFSRLTYNFSGGAAVINFGGVYQPSASSLLDGTKYLYFSPDGNFVFGGSPYGWDMIVGVRTGAAPAFSGLYYQAGVDQDDSQLGTAGSAATNSRFGSVLANSGTEYGHRRVLSPFNTSTFDFTHTDTFTSSNGTYTDPYDSYTFSSDGVYGVGLGTNSLLGINVLLKAPSFSGPGVYINPTGIINVGNNAPFTASLAPGELVAIYGTNLVPAGTTVQVDSTLPTNLNGVQVLVNGTAAPVYAIAHTPSYDQVNAIIPLEITGSIASVQVINGGATSNTVTNFVQATQPGIFNSYLPVPAIQHADYSMVTTSNPVTPGETLLVYLTGIGALDSSGNATEFTANGCNGQPCLTAFIGGVQATILFAGSQLTVGGGYQMNVTVPSTLTTGQYYFLDISGSDSYNSEVQIPVGTVAAALQPSPQRTGQIAGRGAPRPGLRFQPRPSAGRSFGSR